jgi:ribosomal protein S18 acetylase RimI-like enzyme
MDPTGGVARLAHGDAWQALGRLHAALGTGRVAEVPGALLMASGLPLPQYNNADITDPAAVDVAAVARWYDELGVPWGARVPAGVAWSAGRLLFRKRLMALPSEDLVPPAPDGHIELAAAGPDDLDTVLRLDVAAFGDAGEAQRRWLEALLAGADVTVALASWEGTPAGTGYAVRTDGAAGPAVYVAGIGVDPAFRRRGIGAALSARLVEQAGPHRLAHLHPDTDEAVRVYRRLGFVEVPGFDVYVDLTSS